MKECILTAASPVALFLSILPANALNPDVRVSQYAHTAWRLKDGAFTGTPNTVAQTTDGYIWIATDAGLVKFDGVRFVPWQPPPGQKLPSAPIYSLLGAQDGTLWIGTAGGLARWKDNTLVSFSNGAGRINSILEDHAGRIWFTRSRVRDQTGGLCQVVGQEIQCFGVSNGMALPRATALAEDTRENFWIGSDSQLLRWKSGSWVSYFRERLKSVEGLAGVEAIAAGADGTLWVGFSKKGMGLQQLVGGTFRKAILPGVDAANLQISTLFIDRDNSLWAGTVNDGVYRIHGDTVDHFRSEDGLSSNVVEDIRQDREGGLWLTTSRGLDYFRDNPVVSVSVREGLTSDLVSSVLASRDGTIWIGNHGGLDLLRGNKLSTIREQNGLPGKRVTSLLEDREGRNWIGVDNMLTVYEHGRFREIRRPDGTSLGAVVAMAEDTDRNIWAAVIGKNAGLLRIQDQVVREELGVAKIPRAADLAADPAGGIWLGLRDGLAHYFHGRLNVLPLNPVASVQGLFVDADGSLWAATLNGLVRRKEHKQWTLTSKNGLPCDEILATVRDNQKTLWLYSKCGLIAIADSEIERWWQQPDSTIRMQRVLDVYDGAQPSTVTFQPGVSKSPDGRLWFANDSILQMVDPGHLYENRVTPMVQIEQLVADRQGYSTRQNLRLPPRTRDIEIDYTALSFVVPQKVRFRYRMDGRDTDWQEPGTRRQAFYSDLAPGRYRFHVIASNNDGLWNEAGAFLNFSVAPAYYQTLWFRLLCVAFAVGVLAIAYRLRVRQIAAAINARFDERLDERNRLAGDLHDTLLQTIQASKMVTDDALDGNADAIRMRNALERLSEWLAQAMKEGRSALNSLRSSTTQRNDLAEAFQRAGEECRLQRSMEFALSVEGVAQEMHPIARDEIYRIGYEAVRNACVHSDASRLNVELSYLADLILRVSDNGKGMDPDVAANGKGGHFGLIGMYERAARVRGKLTLSSSPGNGTQIELVVPRQIAFQQPDPARPNWIQKIRRLF